MIFTPVINPNLPSGRVGHMVASGEYPQFISELENCGITVLKTECCRDILPAVSYHADMLFAYLGNGEYLIEKSQNELKKQLKDLGFYTCHDDITLNKNYPRDTVLNSCVIGDRLICGKKNIHPALALNRKRIEVTQGYAKCSVCVVNSDSLITDDPSIYSKCVANGMDVLLISKGSVKLKGFDYGFIGGCCGKISEDTVAFCGDLNTHSDADKIKSFLKDHNVFPLSLGKGSLTDIGSLLPISKYMQ